MSMRLAPLQISGPNAIDLPEFVIQLQKKRKRYTGPLISVCQILVLPRHSVDARLDAALMPASTRPRCLASTASTKPRRSLDAARPIGGDPMCD